MKVRGETSYIVIHAVYYESAVFGGCEAAEGGIG
jgi:hypothetical protein